MNTKYNPKPHKQVLAKVNAYVDEDIRELVEILNSFDNVCTSESCQKGIDNFAYIYFTYGYDNYLGRNHSEDNFMEIAKFVHKLAKDYSKLAMQENIDSRNNNLGLGMSVDISLDWIGKRDAPFIRLRVPYKLLKQVTKVFSHLKTEFGQHKDDKQQLHCENLGY
jgi:hypothetical protein